MAGDQPGGSRELSGLIHLLSPRMRRNAELHNDVRSHEHRISELQADISQLERSRDQVYEHAGLKAGDRDNLIRRADQFETWRKLEQERRDFATGDRSSGRTVGRRAGADQEGPRTIPGEAWKKFIPSWPTGVAQRDQLNRRIAEIHTRHERLCSSDANSKPLSAEMDGITPGTG